MKQHNIFGGVDSIDINTGEIIKEKISMKNENTNNIFCYTAAIGFILDQADKMTNSKIYFHKVKQYGNKFLSEIAKHENTFADFVDADVMSESYTEIEKSAEKNNNGKTNTEIRRLISKCLKIENK